MTTFTVTTAADVVNAGDGVLSLREAVQQANASDGNDAVSFASAIEGRTLTLTQGELTVTGGVSIDGDADDDGTATTVSAGDASRVLSIVPEGSWNANDVVKLAGLSLTDGRAVDDEGGGILVGAGSRLELSDCSVTACVSTGSYYGYAGGGIFLQEDAYLRATGCTVSGNSAPNFSSVGGSAGGGIATSDRAQVHLTSSTVSGNKADHGGGISIGRDGYLQLENSSVTDNLADGYRGGGGGGLLIQGRASISHSLIANNTAINGGGVESFTESSVTLKNSTVVGNRAVESDNGEVTYEGRGGGLDGSNLIVRDCTITGNYSVFHGGFPTRSGGIYAFSLDIADSIVAGNYSDEIIGDVSANRLHSNGRNIFGSTTAGSVPGDLENVDAGTIFAAVDPATGGGRLALNGGPTMTVALRDAIDNPALGGADSLSAGGTDQRGVDRPRPGATNGDIGAFELNQSTISTVPTAGNDVLAGTPGADTVSGLGGADLIRGLDGEDALLGNDGSDTLRGGRGNDVLQGGLSSDWLDGGAGVNRVSYLNDASPLGVTVELLGFVARATRGGEVDELFSIQDVVGGNGPDTLLGDFSANRLVGAGGVDRLYGRDGDDVLTGGPGNDRLDGGEDWWNDADRDLADFASGGAVVVDLSLAADRATRGAEVDALFGIEGVIGSGSADTLKGDESANLFRGQGGKDTMTGGTDADLYDVDATSHSAVGANRDVVTDFTAGSDDLDFVTIDARTATPAVNDTFSFLAARGAAFSAAGQVRWYQSAGNTFVEANVDANLAPDLQIQLTGLKTLAAGDFVL